MKSPWSFWTTFLALSFLDSLSFPPLLLSIIISKFLAWKFNVVEVCRVAAAALYTLHIWRPRAAASQYETGACSTYAKEYYCIEDTPKIWASVKSLSPLLTTKYVQQSTTVKVIPQTIQDSSIYSLFYLYNLHSIETIWQTLNCTQVKTWLHDKRTPHTLISYPTLQGKSHLCIPFLGIARPQSQFPHSCVCEQFIYSQEDRSTYFPAAE